MAKERVLCIFGSGPRVGASVARRFSSEGYRVALVSRSKPEKLENEHIHVQSDLSDTSSVAAAFEEIRKSLGHPSVVVYNAGSMTWNEKDDPAALPIEALQKDFAVNTLSVIAAAREAVKGFRQLAPEIPKTFIFTGNKLNIHPIPRMLSGGIGKTATAHFIETASPAYDGEGFKFYYADERKADGTPVYGAVDGEAHATMYWQLAAREAKDVPWLATFVKGDGYKAF